MERTRAYNWLAMTLKLPKYMAHIGYLDSDQCAAVIDESKKLLELMGIQPEERFVRMYGGSLEKTPQSKKRAG